MLLRVWAAIARQSLRRALRGFLHGGANEGAMELLQRFTSPEQAEESVIEALAPATPTYRVLRNALQELRAGSAARGKAEAWWRARSRDPVPSTAASGMWK